MRKLLTGLVLTFVIAAADAAQFVDHEGYRIHYTTFSSMLIPADVAAAHNIVRSEKLVVLNVSARKADSPAPVNVKGYVINLLNQRFDLEFDEVNEAEAIYYLASHMSLEHDILRFELEVTPDDLEAVEIKFLRRYD